MSKNIESGPSEEDPGELRTAKGDRGLIFGKEFTREIKQKERER